MSTLPPSLLPIPISPTKKSNLISPTTNSSSLPILSYAKTVGPATGISLDRPIQSAPASPAKIQPASGIRGPYTRPTPNNSTDSNGNRGKGKGKSSNGNRIKSSNSRNISPVGSSGANSPLQFRPSTAPSQSVEGASKKLESFAKQHGSKKLSKSSSLSSLSALAPAFDFNPMATTFAPPSSQIPRATMAKSSTSNSISSLAEAVPIIESIAEESEVVVAAIMEEPVVQEAIEEEKVVLEEAKIKVELPVDIPEPLPELEEGEIREFETSVSLVEEELEEGEIREEKIPVVEAAIVESIPITIPVTITADVEVTPIETPIPAEVSATESIPEVLEEVIAVKVAVEEKEVIIPEGEDKIEPSVEIVEVAEVEEEITIVEAEVSPIIESTPIVEEEVIEVEETPVEPEVEIIEEEIIVELEMVEVEVEPESVESIIEKEVKVESMPAVEVEKVSNLEIEKIVEEMEEIIKPLEAPVSVGESILEESTTIAATEIVEIVADSQPVESIDSATQTTISSNTATASFPSEPSPYRPNSPSAPNRELVIDSSSPPPPPAEEEPKEDLPSLTLTIYKAWSTTAWQSKIPAVLASIFINVGLPFLNGVFLGIGDLFAREFIASRLGWGNPFSAGIKNTTGGKANTGSVGLRAGLNPSNTNNSDKSERK